MRPRNNFRLVGRLGKAPEKMMSERSRKPVVRFSLAVNNVYKDSRGNKQQATDWFNVVVFMENLGQTCMTYLQKGSEVTVMGHLRASVWEPENWVDGQGKAVKVSRVELIASDMIMHGAPRRDGNGPLGEPDFDDEFAAFYDEDDSLPF